MEATAHRLAATEHHARELSDGEAPTVDVAYRSLLDDLVGYCSRRCPDPHLAEDVAQETFLRAVVRARATGDVPRWPWLMVTATRLLRDMATRDVPVGTVLGADPITARSAEDDAVTRDDVAWLQEAVASLSPMQRDVMLLEDSGWSAQETARALRTTQDNVRQARRRARANLQARWEQRGQGVLLFPVLGWDQVRAWVARWRQRLLPTEAGSIGPVAEALGSVAAATLVTVVGIGIMPTMPDAASGEEQDHAATSAPHGTLDELFAAATARRDGSVGADQDAATWLDEAMEIPEQNTTPPGEPAAENFSVAVTAADVPAASGVSVIEQTNPRAGVQATDEDESTRTIDQSALIDGFAGPIGVIGEVPIYCEGLSGSTLCTAYDTAVPLIRDDGEERSD